MLNFPGTKSWQRWFCPGIIDLLESAGGPHFVEHVWVCSITNIYIYIIYIYIHIYTYVSIIMSCTKAGYGSEME